VIVGCHNMMLSADGTVKVGDFAGFLEAANRTRSRISSHLAQQFGRWPQDGHLMQTRLGEKSMVYIREEDLRG
jgi:hypothetical protein